MADHDDSKPPYEVGYRKPPRRTRFVKGLSGNPKGRGKGVKNFRTEISDELNTLIQITENGRRKRVTKRKAVAKQLVNRAASGDPKAIPTLLNETRSYETEAATAQSASVSEADQSVMDDIVRRILETATHDAGEASSAPIASCAEPTASFPASASDEKASPDDPVAG